MKWSKRLDSFEQYNFIYPRTRINNYKKILISLMYYYIKLPKQRYYFNDAENTVPKGILALFLFCV